MNAPMVSPGATGDDLPTPFRIAAVTSKYWGPSPRVLTVQFLDSPTKECKVLILAHMNAWTKTACIKFKETKVDGQVRLSRGPGGFWSYIGTDILMVPPSYQTMNLEGFTASTSEADYLRVVRHEAGHTLGFTHEHLRSEIIAKIDTTKAVNYFALACGWDAATTQQQVLTPAEARTIMGTPIDVDSIMCYQLPGDIMADGKPVHGGLDIDESDYAFAGRIYPKATARPSVAPDPFPPLRAPSFGHGSGDALSPTAPVVDWGPSPWPREADIFGGANFP